MNRSAFQTARELGEHLFSLAHRVGDPSLLLEAHRVLGQTMFWIGEISASRTHMEQGIVLYNFQQHRSHTLLYGQDPGVMCHSFAAWALWVLGYPEQARRHIVEARTLAQESAHPFSLVHAQMWGAIVYCFCREASAAQTWAEALMTIAREQGFPPSGHWG